MVVAHYCATADDRQANHDWRRDSTGGVSVVVEGDQDKGPTLPGMSFYRLAPVYDLSEDVVQAKLNRADLSVVISTYNRADVLARALESLCEQDLDPSRYEVVVVDNNSTDDTPEVIRSFAGKTPEVLSVFEPRQGVSYGRNTGILTASAPIIAFTDDDVRVPRNWVSTILAVLSQHPEVSCVGGKVLPNWTRPLPPWLTREHWGPLALLDYGDDPLYVDANRRLCLIGANVAFRREVFDEIGTFSPHVQTFRRAAGTEDHELLLRLWRHGSRGLYWPSLVATADIAAERMRRGYHRRWHYRHGRLSAAMRDEHLEQTRRGYLGVPGHIYRQSAASFRAWVASLLWSGRAGAFTREVQLWSGLGFVAARWADVLTRPLRRAVDAPRCASPSDRSPATSSPRAILSRSEPGIVSSKGLSRMQTARAARDLSVVITTYNRADVLPLALESLLTQDLDPARYEIIVVDNNSTDGTRQVVESFAGRSSEVRYVFEPRQGISFGRNAGIRAAVAPIVAFTDDDVRVARDWATTILTVLAGHPEIDCVGGRVLPNWQGPWPAWLTPEHWAPLALLDYGDAPVYVTAERRLCLITANVAYRREVFDRIGMFASHMAWLSDHEILVRLWRARGQGLYWPQLIATADIAPQRMRRHYHRQWHRRHGRFAAIMHDEDFERTKVGHFLGVPAHQYRRVAAELVGWVSDTIRRDQQNAFGHELGLWASLGFLGARWREFLSGHRVPSRPGS